MMNMLHIANKTQYQTPTYRESCKKKSLQCQKNGEQKQVFSLTSNFLPFDKAVIESFILQLLQDSEERTKVNVSYANVSTNARSLNVGSVAS